MKRAISPRQREGFERLQERNSEALTKLSKLKNQINKELSELYSELLDIDRELMLNFSRK